MTCTSRLPSRRAALGRVHRGAHGDLVGSLADSRPSHVYGNVPATDDHHLVAQPNPVSEVDVQEEFNAAKHSVQLQPLDPQVLAAMRPDRQEDRPETLRLKVVEKEIPTHRLVALQFHAQFEDFIDLKLYDLPRKPVFGNAQCEHPSRHGRRLEDRDRISQSGQIVGASQPRRPGANHRDRFLASGSDRQTRSVAEPRVVRIGGGAFQSADRDRLIDPAAAAGIFAGMGAHAAANEGERVRPPRGAVGRLVLTLGQSTHVLERLRAHRAGRMTTDVIVKPCAACRNLQLERLHQWASPQGGVGGTTKRASAAGRVRLPATVPCTTDWQSVLR